MVEEGGSRFVFGLYDFVGMFDAYPEVVEASKATSYGI
jgi:hypothetical protein